MDIDRLALAERLKALKPLYSGPLPKDVSPIVSATLTLPERDLLLRLLGEEAEPRESLDDAVVEYWIDRFEDEMFPHQESEFEQESFTKQGRKRMAVVIQQLVKALAIDAKYRRAHTESNKEQAR